MYAVVSLVMPCIPFFPSITQMKKTPLPKKPKKNNNTFYTFLIMVLLAGAAFSFFSPYGVQQNTEEVSVTELVRRINSTPPSLVNVEFDGNIVVAETATGSKLKAVLPTGTTAADLGILNNDNGVPISGRDKRVENFIAGFIGALGPILIVFVLILFVLRQAQGNANSAFTFGQSRARLHDKERKQTTFKDVAGSDEAKEDLMDIVDFLKHPKKYVKMGAKIPKGVLLYGPPGTGKTLLARAVAGEADVPFFTISGSEFVEMFVGVGASRVRDLFKKAKRSAPAIVFIDEIDAVGRQRGAGLGGGHDEREQTLNQILTEMDGFEIDSNVIVMASTNRPDILDPALLRPGRFDRRVLIDRPNVKEREEILKVHARKKPMDDGIDFGKLAKKLPGFTGADIENLLNESAILAAKRGLKIITEKELTEAFEKVALGPEKKTSRLSDYEKKLTAYHELGHAVVGHLLPHCDPVHKVSIVSRGMALGVTWFLPEDDVHLQSRVRFMQEIASLLGGRAAEEIFFGADNITTGASNDLERASEIARKMVTGYGMSDAIGGVVLETHKNVFLGRDMGETRGFSDKTAQAVDDEVRRIIDEAFTTTKKLITDNKKLIDTMAKDLLIKEEFNEEVFQEYFTEAGVAVPPKVGNGKEEA